MTHATRTGVASFLIDDESSCFDEVRYLLSFLPSNNHEDPPYFAADRSALASLRRAADIVPAEPNRVYDVRDVIEVIVDDGDYLEVQPLWATNIVCAFARLDGHVVGIVANQPSVLAGALNIDAAEKAARFVRTCDAFNIPLVTLVDVPGFLPGVDQEHAGIIRRGAKLLYAYCESTVPRVQVILRKAYGGAYIVMDSKSLGADLSFAWPSNEIAVMGAEGAASIIFRKELADGARPGATSKGAGGRLHRAADDAIHRRGTRDGRRRHRPRRDADDPDPFTRHAALETSVVAAPQTRQHPLVRTGP